MVNNQEEEEEEPANQPEVNVTPLFLLQRNRQIRNMILDYAMGAALLGFNPFRGTLTITLIIVAVIIVKMIRDVGSQWGYAKGQDPLAIAGNIFGYLGAFALAFMAWLTMFCFGLFVPLFSGFAKSAAFFTLTWTLGQVTNQFYANGRYQGGRR
ncbi:hypothetical protein [Aetokthonos hydrillicola]|jgi:uncharacterized protein (DUF697 family)|nr:hypothetical protein [Aetokthonos hydrillicola]MBW4584111.1 hypothetical protein [Aetokthonos hydrillicola CCALA 1050]